jgi:ribosome maturation factor RimP
LLLDVEDPITDDYVLEISSPGLNRTLRKLEHYQRFIGCEIRTRLHPSEDGRRNFRGKLLNATQDKINIEVDGEIYEINQESIEYTRLIPEI